MNRKRREYELLSMQLEEDAETIRIILRKVSECVSEGGLIKAFTRAELNQLWTESTPELRHINKNASSHDAEERALAAKGVLTESGRTALNGLVGELLEPAALLATMSDNAFEKHFLETVAANKAEAMASKKQKAEEKDKWSFINHESATADFRHWSKTTGWEVGEAVALWLGKEPEQAAVALEKLRGPGGSIFRDEFHRRLGYVEGAISVGELDTPISRIQFIAWAKQLGIDPPRELEGNLKERIQDEASKWLPSKAPANPRSRSQTPSTIEDLATKNAGLKREISILKSSTTNERQKTLSILFALAWISYKYNPFLDGPDLIKNIQEDILKLLDWKVDYDTLRKRVSEFADYLPEHVISRLKADAEQRKNELPNSAKGKPNSGPSRR